MKSIILTMLCFLPFQIYSENSMKLGRKAVQSFGERIHKKRGLDLIGSGGSFCDPEKIVLCLHFDTQGNYQIADARMLIVEITEEFIRGMNNSEQCYKIFKKNKISEKNIMLSISFHQQKDYDEKSKSNITNVFLQDEKIVYCYHAKNNITLISKDEENENYQAAKTIVLQQSALAPSQQADINDQNDVP